MGAAHREHARLLGARRESLRVIQVACAEAQCAQRRGALARGRNGICFCLSTGGGVTETLFVRYCQATIKLKRKFALLFWVTYVKPESQQSFTLFEPELSSSCVACTT